LIHEKSTSNALSDLIDELLTSDNLNEIERKNLEISKKDILRRSRLTKEHVESSSLLISQSFESWESARKENDFRLFASNLEKLIQLKQKEADLIGYSEHPYDALIDEFEPGMLTSNLDRIFGQLIPGLNELVKRKPSSFNDDFMYFNYPKNQQWDTGIEVLKIMGYDFNKGRQDISTHPFTISIAPDDVRITTRIDENNLYEMMWSCIHEGGHALYEQGISLSHIGTPHSEAASLSIHESQSRLWENQIGRGEAFWGFYFNQLKTKFPEQLRETQTTTFLKAINQIKPSLIRTNADELTYHYHVFIRYELEKKLIEGSLKVSDLKEQWNALYKEYLKIDVPDDVRGILQDVHWSHGSFGYFPTYTLGSLYAAQFYHSAQQQIKDLEKQISEGNMTPLLQWLRTNIHSKGRLFSSEELCEQISGERLNNSYFLEYAKKKFI
jgi:carboxypeptidase Taq